MPELIYPPKPQPGDRVAVVSPSRGLPEIFPEVYETGLTRLRDVLKLEPVEYPTTRTMGADPRERARDLQAAFADNWMKTHADVFNSDVYFPQLDTAGDVRGQIFKSSPREGGDSARLMFLLSISAARHRILIGNSYFVPDSRTIRALVAALKLGVVIEIIVPGHHIDTKITRRASRFQWGPLLEAGARIFEYQPTMFHCKLMVIDDCWVSVGSTNFDIRSFRLNDEANLNVIDTDFANQQAEMFAADKNASRQVTLTDWRQRPWSERGIECFANLFKSQV